MNIDYANLEQDVENGIFGQRLEEELTVGFRAIHEQGERLPPASYLAAQIAEIVNRDAELSPDLKYNLYQEILAACEKARATVLGEEPS
ncbi:MAG TPA: hypothetical protein VM733_01185 [Thermoanaerobaculia bacterium]|nr:hypothetical protein [Thermoanaerobaculia bacterium]